MNLTQKQMLFPQLLTKLWEWAWGHGYMITLGEAWRSDETAALDAKEGKGIDKSLHRLRIADDLNLWKKDPVSGQWIYLTKTEDYQPLGTYWESLSTTEYQCCWGGRFSDGNHFSICHNGVK